MGRKESNQTYGSWQDAYLETKTKLKREREKEEEIPEFNGRVYRQCLCVGSGGFFDSVNGVSVMTSVTTSIRNVDAIATSTITGRARNIFPVYIAYPIDSQYCF